MNDTEYRAFIDLLVGTCQWPGSASKTLFAGAEAHTMGLLGEANDVLRSVHEIAVRKGEATNWDALQRRLESVLVKQGQMNKTVDDDTCGLWP